MEITIANSYINCIRNSSSNQGSREIIKPIRETFVFVLSVTHSPTFASASKTPSNNNSQTYCTITASTLSTYNASNATTTAQSIAATHLRNLFPITASYAVTQVLTITTMSPTLSLNHAPIVTFTMTAASVAMTLKTSPIRKSSLSSMHDGFADLAEEMGADHSDCMLVDFDEEIPFKQEPKDQTKAIFDILMKTYLNPSCDFQEFDNEYQPLQISKEDFKINSDGIKQIKQIYSKPLVTIFNGEMKDDQNILKILAISEKR